MQMTTLIVVAGWIELASLALGTVAFIVTSILERRWRAILILGAVLIPSLLAFAAILLYDFPAQIPLILAAIAAGMAALFMMFVPVGRITRMRSVHLPVPVDERDAIFSRFHRLVPGSDEFEEYYRRRPEKLEGDNDIRRLPFMAAPGSRVYHPLASPFTWAAFDVVEKTAHNIEWSPEPLENKCAEASAEEFTRRIKGFAHYLGAAMVGTTSLNPAYVYTHIGRSPGVWGEPISLDHTNAIAIAVEMDHEMLRHAPQGPAITESAAKYLRVAEIAMTLARYINRLGYRARAHIDGNYRVMCVPIAVDAGLGELGRIGYLITPRLGPRVRLAVVTTDLPLTQDERIYFGVQDFCEACKKCASNCPSAAIPSEGKTNCRGVEKWVLNTEACYKFWRTCGTDCAICMKVCPYSHPDTFFHNFMRWVLSRNGLVRRYGITVDDLIYGRRPKISFPMPAWLSEKEC